mmetsp:Transcript_18082/g.50180  ORF Transcript_18082/g.50180 Transcript_18082/m.50180 type:complete len:237 (+) Transcript_18082:2193-2903(+)
MSSLASYLVKYNNFIQCHCRLIMAHMTRCTIQREAIQACLMQPDICVQPCTQCLAQSQESSLPTAPCAIALLDSFGCRLIRDTLPPLHQLAGRVQRMVPREELIHFLHRAVLRRQLGLHCRKTLGFPLLPRLHGRRREPHIRRGQVVQLVLHLARLLVRQIQKDPIEDGLGAIHVKLVGDDEQPPPIREIGVGCAGVKGVADGVVGDRLDEDLRQVMVLLQIGRGGCGFVDGQAIR